MPKLSDAINKVNQEEAHRKKPVKRRPYLDNIAPKIEVEETIQVRPKTSNILKANSHAEILQAQIGVNQKSVELKPSEKPVDMSEVGEKPKTSLPYFAKKEFKTIPSSHGKSAEEIILKSNLPLEEVDNIEEVFEVDVESQSFDFLSPPPIDKKLKPLADYFPNEIAEPVVTKAVTKSKPISTPNVINNSPSSVNPKGTMGTDEEDGVDLSIYNLEQFGHTTKTVLFYIFRKAKENKCLVTPPLKKNDLQKECGINFNTIKSVLQRLSHYKFIKLEKYQRGPFGWTRYSIRESLYNQLLYNYDGLMPTHRPEKFGTNIPENNYAEVGEDITLADSLKEIGFNMGHINQLKKMPMASDKIQNSLDAFAFDMLDKEFKTKIRSPLAVFMKVAKTEGEYISSRGYVSQEDEILQQMIQLKKDRALQTKKQQDELLNLSFNEWLNTKTKDEINKIAPPSGDYLGPLHKATLKNWYQENVFDTKSQ